MGCSPLGSSFVEQGLILSGWGDLRGSQEGTISSQDGNTWNLWVILTPSTLPWAAWRAGLALRCARVLLLQLLCWEGWMDGAAAAGVWVLQLTQCVFQAQQALSLV